MDIWTKIWHLFTEPELVEAEERYRPLMLPLHNGWYPTSDPDGNKLANIARLNITGTTFSYFGSVPSEVIPKLVKGESLILAPDPQNKVDNEAIRVFTEKLKYIGWVPRSYAGKGDIFRRLIAGKYVCCVVLDHGVVQYESNPWCEIGIATYEE